MLNPHLLKIRAKHA